MMERPQWQKSEAMLFFGEIVVDIFSTMEEKIRQNDHNMLDMLSKVIQNESEEPFFALHAMKVDIGILADESITSDITLKKKLPDGLTQHMNQYMFGGSLQQPRVNFREAITTMWVFPINVLGQVMKAGVDISTMQDVARLYRNPSFKAIVNRCSLTANSFWEQWSSSRMYTSPYISHGGSFVEAIDEKTLRLRPELKTHLNERLVTSRQEKKVKEEGPSSGCPARHLRPKYDLSNPRDLQSLQQLADYFNTTETALLEPREQSYISDCLDTMANIVECIDNNRQKRLVGATAISSE